MKIQILDQATKKPLTNTKVQLQVRGKDSGYLTITTDAAGYATLEDKLNGQQLAVTKDGTAGTWTAATEGAKLYTTGTTTGTAGGKERQTTTNKQ
jgi:hypothetical protein